MKPRRLLPLIYVAAGALFLLSGCDAMLDAIFPSNQITVDVAVSRTSYYNDWYAAFVYGSYPGSVTLYMYDNGNPTAVTATWSSADANYVHYTFTFIKLKDHAFSFEAFYVSGHGSVPGYTGRFYDPSGYYFDFPIAITMPFHNSHDSTGHLVDLYMYI